MEGAHLLDPLVETWEIHARINLCQPDGIPPEVLRGASVSKGRTVGEPFAHVHNISPTCAGLSPVRGARLTKPSR
jgi:hypothetical protein